MTEVSMELVEILKMEFPINKVWGSGKQGRTELAKKLVEAINKAYILKGMDPNKRDVEERKITREAIIKHLTKHPLHIMRPGELAMALEMGYTGQLGDDFRFISAENTIKILNLWIWSEVRKAAHDHWMKTRTDLLPTQDDAAVREAKNAAARKEAWDLCWDQVATKSVDLEHWAWRLAFRYLATEEGFILEDQSIKDMYQSRAEDIVKEELEAVANSEVFTPTERESKTRSLKYLVQIYESKIEDPDLNEKIALVRRKLIVQDYINEIINDLPREQRILTPHKIPTHDNHLPETRAEVHS